MLKRKIENRMLEWYELTTGKPALMIMGARQVGKTTSIRSFAKRYYPAVLEMNFEAKPSLKQIFSGDLDADTLIEKISVSGLGRIIPHKTLLFLDEIQSCPQARTALKFLVEDGRLDIIASGSLLGINYREVSSYPVGFEHRIEMHSLDFEEFLWANGVPEETIASVHQSFLLRKPVDDYINTRLMDLFKKYMIVGGMPAVVMEYLKSREFGGVLMRQRSIVQSYRDDISKYAGKRKGEAKRVFDSIPAQLMEKNKRFKLSDIDPNARSRTYHDAIMWLYDAGIATFCYNVTSPEIPFELNEKRNIFKFFMRDTGLLSSMSLGNIQSAILAGDLQINEGAIVENAIADLLVKRGYNLHYWDVKGRLEVDFLIHESHAVLPVEVKSGKDYSKHPSLTRLIDLHREHIPEAIVLHRGQVHKDHNISYLPLYMVMFL